MIKEICANCPKIALKLSRKWEWTVYGSLTLCRSYLEGSLSFWTTYYTAFIQRSNYEMHQMKFSLPCCQVSLSFRQSFAQALLILFLIRFQTSNVHVHLFLANTWKNSLSTHPPSDDQLALDCPQQWSCLITLATISVYPFISLTSSCLLHALHPSPVP